ncbi:hypothetical protein AB3S75_034284 [Citrus x aurantiifolia]
MSNTCCNLLVMQSMATSEPKMRLKLLIDRKDDRVIFSEAGKDIVDFLFYLFSLPIGTAVKVLGPQSMVGCMGDLSQSLKTLDKSYMQPNKSRTSALSSRSPISFVKGVVTYLVMDNLKVMPMSTLSTITLLNNDNVKDIGALEEKIVHVGMNEGLDLLQASLECKGALTSVFMRN